MKRILFLATILGLCLPFFGPSRADAAPISLAIVNADSGSAPVAQLLATGLFSSVTAVDAQFTTPTLATLLGFDAVLAYTNFVPADATALGNVLADYVDAGHRLTIATYGFSNPWAIKGRITTTGYSPLTNLGVNGDVSGMLSAVVPTDPVFFGVDPSTVMYFHNGNYAHPGLDAGATLIATDGAGIDMIALNGNGLIYGINIYPGTIAGNNAAFYQLLGNSLNPPMQGPNAVPEPSSLMLLGLGAFGLVGYGWRRRKTA